MKPAPAMQDKAREIVEHGNPAYRSIDIAQALADQYEAAIRECAELANDWARARLASA